MGINLYIIFFAHFFPALGYRDRDQMVTDSRWETVCREVKPVHLFYERFNSSVGEQISCRLRGEYIL